ncbi:putative monooxygenase [Hyaloraphidium curvatum]|nr:putative monooxygenase [Hyaloraphidium curvatum]
MAPSGDATGAAAEPIVDFDNLGFDPIALRRKYDEERDRRIRPDGNDQYVNISDFSEYLVDPYVPHIEREQLHDEVDVLIVGGGFGAQLAAVRLQQAGVGGKRVRIVEKGGDFGGTWYWNRYPGAQCDIESYIYLPLLEETGYMPVEKYTRAAEILAYSRVIAEKWNLYDQAILQTEITGMKWEEASSRWVVTTNRGDEMRARFVALVSGPLHRPKLVGAPGIERFKGHSFHTSRWDYEYTGGGPNGGLDKLKDKRVGIIGTGATAIQCVPHLGESAKHLYVFQRTPSAVSARGNKPTDPEWVASLKTGWQDERKTNFNNIMAPSMHPDDMVTEDLVQDGWTSIFTILAQAAKTAPLDPAKMAERIQLADYIAMNRIRDRVDLIVKDKKTAEALKPWYNFFCKRPTFNDDYLPTFNRPNVTLVDTAGKGIERIEETGVVVDGKLYEIDCLVYACGFEVGTSFSRRCGFEIYGRDGVSLTEKWADGCRTLHGMTTNGFPNAFIFMLQQAGFTGNVPHVLDEQARHFAYIVSKALEQGAKEVECTTEAEDAWVEECVNKAQLRREFLQACTPGYYNDEGKLGKSALIVARNSPYGAGSQAFIRLIKEWQKEGNMKGLKVTLE